MTGNSKIDSTPSPATVDSLKKDLTGLGIQPGMVLLVHSSFNSLGWISGGPVAVILALEELLGLEGTLVMPTHSGDLSDPGQWQNPPVPESWWETIRGSMPAYDPALTLTWKMGILPETFRKQDRVTRSDHPQLSFAAWGAEAKAIVDEHTLENGLGEGSPLARIYEQEGWVLLLGVGHANNTSLHLAEYRANLTTKKYFTNGAPMMVNGRRQWVEFSNLNLDSDDFPQIGKAFSNDTGLETFGQVAMAEARLMPQKELVDYAVWWMENNRG
ncbi:MAG TPA: AAC(3) family N-acetyltransferase [Anaerolineales bacterium]|jgi:aminoglycoside 3-N-acetyltransferase|nr:AAC(3) family N-acetyltransferase [Anaerolineales bacterium]